MASSTCNRVISRVSSSLKSAIAKPPSSRSPLPSLSHSRPSTPPSPPFPPAPKISSFIRSPVEQLGCVQSLLPLHSAVAIARLNSCLSASSTSCHTFSLEYVEGT